MILRFLTIYAVVAVIVATPRLEGSYTEVAVYDEHKTFESLVRHAIHAEDFAGMHSLAQVIDRYGGIKRPRDAANQLLSPAAAASLGVFSDGGLYRALKAHCTSPVGELMLADILSQGNTYSERIKVSNDDCKKISNFSKNHSKLVQEIIESFSVVSRTKAIPSDMGGDLFASGADGLRDRYVQNGKWALSGMKAFWGSALLAQSKVLGNISSLFDSGDISAAFRALANAPRAFTHDCLTSVFPINPVYSLIKVALSNGEPFKRGMAAAKATGLMLGSGFLFYRYASIRAQYAQENNRVRRRIEAIHVLCELLPGSELSKEYCAALKNVLAARLPGAMQELYAKLMYGDDVYFRMLLVDAYREFGIYDAYCAVKKWADAHTEHIANIEFDTAQECDLKDMWSVEIGPKESSRVSLRFDKETKAYKIEGPNGFGKSTILRMFANNVILANRFGIVAAAQGSKIPSYQQLLYIANVQETKGSASTGQKQGKSFQDTLDSLNKATRRTVVILDEPLFGTTQRVASKPIDDLMKAAISNKNVHAVIVTHHNIDLGWHKGLKHVHLGSQEDKPFQPSYTLESGRHPWWFSVEKKAQKMCSEFSEDMFGHKEILESLQKTT